MNAKRRRRASPPPGGQALAYARPSSFVTVDYGAAPAWVATNRYILSGYRAFFSFPLATRSLFRWHNESLNIWSHIAGAALAAACLWALVTRQWLFATPPRTPPGIDAPAAPHAAPFALFAAAGVAAFAASAIYHTYCCASAPVARLLARFDYLGIALLMTAAFMPGIHFGFACFPLLSAFYQLLVAIVAAVAFAILLFPDMAAFHASYYSRLALYTALAAFAAVPLSHWVYVHGADSEEVALIFSRMLVIFLWLALAALIYVFQIPERWAPGVFDHIGHSHQLWHLIAIAIFWYHLNSALLYLDYRNAHPCPPLRPFDLIARAAAPPPD